MRKDPAERYQSMAELVSDLDAVRKVEPPVEETKSGTFTVPKPRRLKNLAGFAVLGTALLLTLGYAPIKKHLSTHHNVHAEKKRAKRKTPDDRLRFKAKKLPFILKKDGETRGRKSHLVWRPTDLIGADNVKVTDGDLLALSKEEPHDLDFKGCEVTGTGLQYLDNWPVKVLNMSATALTDEGLAQLVKLRQLDHLSICHNSRITDNGVKLLSKLKNLYDLDMSNCSNITNEGVRYIIKNCKSIGKLDVAGTRVTSELLPEYAELPKLEKLTLSNLRITDKDMTHFVFPKKLAVLDLSKNAGVTDVTLNRVAKVNSVEAINIGECPGITEGAIQAFLGKRVGRRVGRVPATPASFDVINEVGELMH
ncbi:MAG: hypothetical protein K2Z81_22010 [Cyanobacteria bacterium]|nr:hypothetical protein [Cyanobacteriota bacterium]